MKPFVLVLPEQPVQDFYVYGPAHIQPMRENYLLNCDIKYELKLNAF